jgi:hypothetical protein
LKPVSGLIREGFSQLLNNPQARRVPRDVEMQNAPTVVADDKKAAEHTEGDCWHGEEVHRRNGFSMVAQERKPAFRRLGISRRFADPTRDGSLGSVEAGHDKFTMNPRCSPRRIFGDHPENQISDLF